MKIWREFNSSHSSNITVIGKFERPEDLNKAYDMIVDFTLGVWESRYPSVKEFLEYWSDIHPNVRYIDITNDEYQLGIDNAPHFEKSGDTITISELRHNNLGGLIIFLHSADVDKIVIE